MSAARKPLPPPGGGADLTATLRRRYERTDDTTTTTSSDTSATDRTSATSSTRATSGGRPQPTPVPAAAVRRSWYMPASTADALAAALDDLHFATRRPKAEVLAALVAVAIEHQDEAHQRLTAPSDE